VLSKQKGGGGGWCRFNYGATRGGGYVFAANAKLEPRRTMGNECGKRSRQKVWKSQELEKDIIFSQFIKERERGKGMNRDTVPGHHN